MEVMVDFAMAAGNAVTSLKWPEIIPSKTERSMVGMPFAKAAAISGLVGLIAALYTMGVRSFNLAGFMADIYLDAKTFQMIGKRGRNAIRTGYGISLMMHDHRQTVHAAPPMPMKCRC